MNDMATSLYDVIVVGGGLAGISAALAARSRGASVALVCQGPLCDGSSFSRNTWGLGMVSESQDPQIRAHQSLSKALKTMGMGLCTPGLAERLIEDADDAIAWLESLGAVLRVPQDAGQREYVPCFDSHVRTWRGFLADDSAKPLAHTVRSAGIEVFEHTETLSLLGQPGQIGGVFTLHKMCVPLVLEAPAVILACGGLAGIYRLHICPTTTGLGHLMALEAGASLVNIEFQQLMVGYLGPLHGVVFNEKLWRWVDLLKRGSVGEELLSPSESALDSALEAHSWHGPFTAERESLLVEQVIGSVPRGEALARIQPEALGEDAPGIISDYVRWLEEDRNVSAGQSLPVALFAHSSNGGVAIDENGFTRVGGLFAAGEMSGGVHGADRIGGLASVSAVVFGRRAGLSATDSMGITSSVGNLAPLAPLRKVSCDTSDLLRRMAASLDRHCLVPRDDTGLHETISLATDGLSWLEKTSRMMPCDLGSLGPDDWRQVGSWRRCQATLTLARALALAMAERTETRGSHMRSDYPSCDPSQTHQLAVTLSCDGKPQVRSR